MSSLLLGSIPAIAKLDSCTDHRNASTRENTSGLELKQSISVNGSHFYAFLAFIAFMALGAAAAAFAAFFMLIGGGLEKDFRGCKCHSRQASLNQTKQQVTHSNV